MKDKFKMSQDEKY